MAIISGLIPNCTGVIYPKLALHINRYDVNRLKPNSDVQFVSERISKARLLYFSRKGYSSKCIFCVRRNPQELQFDDDFAREPFWLTPIKEAFWGLKSLFAFLAEQPSQLKYIEWPSFQSTLKTATLTLVLVALLIVALSSVDAALCYLLAVLLRRTV